MILDADPPLLLLPLLLVIGLCLVIYGREILKTASFLIGAIGGGVLAYMLLEGLLYMYVVPLWIEIAVATVLVLLGGLFGSGTMAMLVALFISIVVMDATDSFLGDDEAVIIYVVGLICFVAMVVFIQKFLFVFSSFIGGVLIALSATPLFDALDEPVVRVVQLIIALIFCIIGSLVQHFIYKAIEKRKEEKEVWVPKPKPA